MRVRLVPMRRGAFGRGAFGAVRANPDVDVVGRGGAVTDIQPIVSSSTPSIAVPLVPAVPVTQLPAPVRGTPIVAVHTDPTVPVATPAGTPAQAIPVVIPAGSSETPLTREQAEAELQAELARRRATQAAAEQAVLDAQRAEEARLRRLEEGQWEQWCRANPKEYNGEVWVCRRDFPGGALVPGAPWTQAGKAARWIAATKKEDYEDIEKLFVIAWTDPVKFWQMVFAATFVIPVLGPAYVMSMQTPVGILAAIGESMKRGGGGQAGLQRVWDKLLYPIWQKNSGLVWNIVKYGPSPAALVVFLLQREAMNDRYPAEVKAMMLALADSADLVDVIADPKRITEAGTIAKLGSTLARVSSVFEQTAPAVAMAVKGLGRAMELNAVPISILMKQGPAGAAEALDEFGGRILGVKPSVIQARGVAAVRSAAAPNPDLLKSMKDVEKAINTLASAIDGIKWGDLQKALAGPVRFIRDLMSGQIRSVEQLFRELTTAPVGVEAPATVTPQLPADTGSTGGSASGGGGGGAIVVVDPTTGQITPVTAVPATRASGAGVGLAIAGAGAGFLAGGPIAGVVGGVAGWLLGHLKKGA